MNPEKEASQGNSQDGGKVLSPETLNLVSRVAALPQNEALFCLRVQLFLYAQAYHQLLQSVVGLELSTDDVTLNDSYLRVIDAIQGMLKMEVFKDFPMKFEPVLEHLFSGSGIEVLEWDDIAPDVNSFLSSSQSYINRCGSIAPANNALLEDYLKPHKENIVKIIEYATEHRRRMRTAFPKVLQRVPQPKHPVIGSSEAEHAAAKNSKPSPTHEVAPESLREAAKGQVSHVPPLALIAEALGSGGVRLKYGTAFCDCRNRGGELLQYAVQIHGGCLWNRLPKEVRAGDNSVNMKKRVHSVLQSAPPDIRKLFKVTANGVEISSEVTYVPLPK